MAGLISGGDYAVHARADGATQLIFLNRKQSRMTDALNLMSPKQKAEKKKSRRLKLWLIALKQRLMKTILA